MSFLSNLYTQSGAQTHAPETESHASLKSQQGKPKVFFVFWFFKYKKHPYNLHLDSLIFKN